MHALITGAAGFVGTHLAHYLSQRGDTIRCLLLPTESPAALAALTGVEILRGDVAAPSGLDDAVRGVDVVYHLAGIRRSPDPKAFDRVNAQGTRHVCEALAATGRRSRLVLAGSLAATGPSSPGRPRVEDDPPNPQEWYGESKVRAEQIALSYLDRLDVAVARPARILGPLDRENLAFAKLLRRGVRLSILGPDRPLSLVDVGDVVRAMVLLATSPEAVGQAFFIARDETTTLERLQELMADAMGQATYPLYLPPVGLRALAGLADVYSTLTGKHLPLNRKLARQLLASAWTCSTEKARRVLKFEAQVSIEASVRASVRSYREAGLL